MHKLIRQKQAFSSIKNFENTEEKAHFQCFKKATEQQKLLTRCLSNQFQYKLCDD